MFDFLHEKISEELYLSGGIPRHFNCFPFYKVQSHIVELFLFRCTVLEILTNLSSM